MTGDGPLVTVLLSLLLVSCGGHSASSVPKEAATSYKVAYRGLCAAEAVADHDREAARRSFYDRSHTALHDLTRAAELRDRSVAGRLLERMQAV